jgi:hypothetical protein
MADQEPTYETLMEQDRRRLDEQALVSANLAMLHRVRRAGAGGKDVLNRVEGDLERLGIPTHVGLDPMGVEDLEPSERRHILEQTLGILRETAMVWERPVVEAQHLDWERQKQVTITQATQPDSRGHRHVTKEFPDGSRERLTFETDEDWFGYLGEQTRQEADLEAARREVRASRLPEDIRTKLDSAEELFKTLPGWSRHGRAGDEGMDMAGASAFRTDAKLLLRAINGATTEEVRNQLEQLITGELIVVPDEQAKGVK